MAYERNCILGLEYSLCSLHLRSQLCFDFYESRFQYEQTVPAIFSIFWLLIGWIIFYMFAFCFTGSFAIAFSKFCALTKFFDSVVRLTSNCT